MVMIVICAACGKDDAWEGFEDVVRLTGQEGNIPEKITIAACECGYQQTVIME
jgi:hypothetical protein